MPPRTLTPLELNRALLARQLLLERVDLPFESAIARVGAVQNQYAPSAYVALWTRLRGVVRDAVTAALEEGSLVQGTLLRVTIHVVGRGEYWRYVAGIRRARRAWLLRTGDRDPEARLAAEARHRAAADELRAALAAGPRYAKELDAMGQGFLGNAGLWVDLVRVPPSGTWERRRADRLALAEAWVGPDDATEEEGLAHLVRTYLAAFGPAPWKDIAAWAGIAVQDARQGGSALTLASYRDELGRPLVDLPGALLPDADTPAPVRFLSHWDATTLAHARRTGVLPEHHRARVYSDRNPFSMGTVLVDGRAVAGWRVHEGRVQVELFDPSEPLSRRDRDAVEDERAALEAFCA